MIHTTHALSPKGQQRHLRYSSEMPTFYHDYSAMSNTADVTGGKPIAACSQSISSGSAINPLVSFYDIHGRKREVLYFYFVPDTTRDWMMEEDDYDTKLFGHSRQVVLEYWLSSILGCEGNILKNLVIVNLLQNNGHFW
jgi:hypothetical protein